MAAGADLKKLSHREQKKEECRQSIVDAALTLFEQKGYDATTMDEIAQSAKVSRPTVFNYFARKEDILAVIGVKLTARLKAEMEAIAPSEREVAPVATLRRLLVSMASLFAEYPETSRAFHKVAVMEQHLRRKAAPRCPVVPHEDPQKVEMQRFFEHLIEAGQRQGEIRGDFPPKEILLHLVIGLFASTLGPAEQGVFGDEPLPSVVARHFDLSLSGIRA
ncbi:HTH-type transcriptional regulator AcrR [compost metagenome]